MNMSATFRRREVHVVTKQGFKGLFFLGGGGGGVKYEQIVVTVSGKAVLNLD